MARSPDWRSHRLPYRVYQTDLQTFVRRKTNRYKCRFLLIYILSGSWAAAHPPYYNHGGWTTGRRPPFGQPLYAQSLHAFSPPDSAYHAAGPGRYIQVGPFFFPTTMPTTLVLVHAVTQGGQAFSASCTPLRQALRKRKTKAPCEGMPPRARIHGATWLHRP